MDQYDSPAGAASITSVLKGRHEQGKAFGASLADWQQVYWQWAFGQVDLPVDKNGNTVVGHVVLMPLPDNGSLDVTLKSGQAFMLPLWVILGTSWDDGTPTDPALPLSLFETLDITLKIDGVAVIDGDNVLEFYSAFDFDPEIPLPADWSPYQAIVWFQGIGMVHPPLSAGQGGQHTITLDAKNTIPVVDGKGDAYEFEYHNTWNVTVQPSGDGECD
jgi:hypothetical protein